MPLTEERYEQLLRELYQDLYEPIAGMDVDGTQPHFPPTETYEQSPEHLRLEFGARVLRYLRNYILARHGHPFETPGFQQCFRDLPQWGTWTDVERANFEFLRMTERELIPRRDAAWKAIGVTVPAAFPPW